MKRLIIKKKKKEKTKSEKRGIFTLWHFDRILLLYTMFFFQIWVFFKKHEKKRKIRTNILDLSIDSRFKCEKLTSLTHKNKHQSRRVILVEMYHDVRKRKDEIKRKRGREKEKKKEKKREQKDFKKRRFFIFVYRFVRMLHFSSKLLVNSLHITIYI